MAIEFTVDNDGKILVVHVCVRVRTVPPAAGKTARAVRHDRFTGLGRRRGIGWRQRSRHEAATSHVGTKP